MVSAIRPASTCLLNVLLKMMLIILQSGIHAGSWSHDTVLLKHVEDDLQQQQLELQQLLLLLLLTTECESIADERVYSASPNLKPAFYQVQSRDRTSDLPIHRGSLSEQDISGRLTQVQRYAFCLCSRFLLDRTVGAFDSVRV